jgi:hypothetical protein
MLSQRGTGSRDVNPSTMLGLSILSYGEFWSPDLVDC